MAANLSSDGLIWKVCRVCSNAIYRYPGGQVWRDYWRDSECKGSPVKMHIPEY